MIAPAAFWTGAALSSNATGTNNAGALLPSIPESLVLGSLFGSHKKGFQAGGLLGYSTFFTGYDPGRMGGGMRALSVGRLTGGAVSAVAQGLLNSPIGKGAAGDWLARLTLTSKYGIGSAITSLTNSQIPVRGLGFSGKINPDLLGDGGIVEWNKKYLQSDKTWRGKAGRWLTGVFGGVGSSSTLKEVTVGSRTLHVNVADAGSKGHTFGGTAGRVAGAAAKLSAGVMIASFAANAAADVAGAAYGSLVRTNTRLRDQVGASQTMSPGYYNQAAVTERQRAVMELNQNVLNPRTQMMGNEAGFMHR